MDIEKIVRELNANRLMDADGDATYSVHVNVAERLIFEAQQIGADQQINRLKLIEKERDALRAQLETTKRELTATTISWENAQAELDRLSRQKPIGFLLEHSDGAEFYNMEMSANFNCTDKIQASVSPVYAAPVPAMPIQSEQALQLIAESRENFEKQFGSSADADWVYKDLAELMISDLPESKSSSVPIPKQEPAGAEHDEETNFCALKSITDSQVNAVARAFWRRIYAYRNDYGIELPKPLPVEFMAHMATALTWVDKEPSPRITEQDAREIIEDYIGYCDGKRLKPQSSVVMGMYIKNECTAILNKLNANAVTDVKQEIVGITDHEGRPMTYWGGKANDPALSAAQKPNEKSHG